MPSLEPKEMPTPSQVPSFTIGMAWATPMFLMSINAILTYLPVVLLINLCMYVWGAGGHGMAWLAPLAKAMHVRAQYMDWSLRIQASAASGWHPCCAESDRKAKTTEGTVRTVLASSRVFHFDSAGTITYLRLSGFWKDSETGGCFCASALSKYIDKTTSSDILANQANSARRHMPILARHTTPVSFLAVLLCRATVNTNLKMSCKLWVSLSRALTRSPWLHWASHAFTKRLSNLHNKWMYVVSGRFQQTMLHGMYV